MSSHRILLTTAVVSLACGASALAGGIERFCPNGTTGNSVVEAWPNPVAVPWRLAGVGSGNFPAPGFSHIQCAGAPASAASPVAQSVYNAIAAWNTASLNPSVPSVSGFSFATPATPTLVPLVTSPLLPANEGGLVPMAWWNANRSAVGLLQRDGANTITMWDGAGSFTANMGGPAALAISGVFATAAGVILECDVALNARAPFTFTGAATWSFVETNTAVGVTMASQSTLNPSGFTLPIAGFADLEGVLVHELGHFAGLGHSLVESTISPSQSQTPTMFPIAQPEPNFSATLGTQGTGSPGSCTFTPVVVNSNLPILGRSARDLTLDDKFAIAEGYPLPADNVFWANTGILTGTVFGTNAQPLRGVTVTAIDVAAPNARRVGTLTFDDGTYRIIGLEPGRYFLKFEQVDSAASNAFFVPGNVPNYVQGPGALGCVGTAPPLLTTEWFDANETNPESSNSNADYIDLMPAQTFVADIKLNSDQNHLVLSGAGTLNASSPRGLQLNPGDTATLFVRGATPGSLAFVWVDVSRGIFPFGAQVSEVNPVAVFSAVVDAAGVATVAIPVGAPHLNNNFFAQGLFADSAGSLILTNSVNFWVN